MGPVLETVLLFLVKQVLTEGVIKAGEQALVDWMKAQVAKTENRIDDYVVEVVAEALGVKL